MIETSGVFGKKRARSSKGKKGKGIKKKRARTTIGMQEHEIIAFYRKCLDKEGHMTADSFVAMVKVHLKQDRLSKSSVYKKMHVRKMAKSIRLKEKLSLEPKDQDVEEAQIKNETEASNEGAKSDLMSDGAESDARSGISRESHSSPPHLRGRSPMFVCEFCDREFVREKGLEAHQTNECTVAIQVRDERKKAKGGISGASNAILDEVHVSDDDIYDYDFTEDAVGSGGEYEEFSENDNFTHETMDRQYDAADVQKIARKVLRRILQRSLLLGWNTQDIFQELDADKSGFLSIVHFRDIVKQKFGFRPSKAETSAVFLLLDIDRSGDIEQQEFELYASAVMGQLQAGQSAGATVDGKHDLLPTDLLVDGEQERDGTSEESDLDEPAFGNFQDNGKHNSSWQLLESYWSMEESAVRQCVHDFGGHDEKFSLVLLDKLMNDEDEDGSVRDAWRCFRELCAFTSRLQRNITRETDL
eukprot:g1587.t1